MKPNMKERPSAIASANAYYDGISARIEQFIESGDYSELNNPPTVDMDARKIKRAKHMLANWYTMGEVAQELGIKPSTLTELLKPRVRG